MNRKKWTKISMIVSIISYVIAFFIKIIGGYLGIEYFLLMKAVMIFAFIGAGSSGLIGILNDGFWFKSFEDRSTYDGLTPEEIAEIKKLVEERCKEE